MRRPGLQQGGRKGIFSGEERRSLTIVWFARMGRILRKIAAVPVCPRRSPSPTTD
jgi:hypothetical protein